MLQIKAETGSEAYLTLLDHLLGAPTTAPRGLVTRELRDVTVEVNDPYQAHVLRTTRKPNLKIAAVEAWQLLAGVSCLSQLDAVSGGRFSQFADGGRLRGAYGPRTHGQLLSVAVKLRADPDTRQAYVTVWNGDELDVASRDTPCTTGFQFTIREGKLHLRVTMRSNDAWLGFPIDVMQFSALHRTMAAGLDLEPGSYVHSVGSLHLYEVNLDEANRVVDSDLTTPWGAPEVQRGIPIPPSNPFKTGKSGFSMRSFFAEQLVTRTTTLVDTSYGPLIQWVADRVPPLAGDEAKCLECRYVVSKVEGCIMCDYVRND